MKQVITLEEDPEGGFNLQKDGKTCFCADRGAIVLTEQFSKKQVIHIFPCNTLCPKFIDKNLPHIQILCGGNIADYKVDDTKIL